MNKMGFTMIELLSIVVVLSIILVIAIPKFIDSLNASKEKEREKIYEIIKSAGKSYSSINNIPTGEPILLSTLCEEKYLECPITDPVTEQKMNGYVYSRIDVGSNSVITYNYVGNPPIVLSDTILATVGTKDVDVNKYNGNGLYKWGSKYIYRGGITKTNASGLATGSYTSDVDSGSEVSNYIKVPWEIYTTGENCTSTTNKCYRIIGINTDGSITIVRDKNFVNQRFDNTFNSSAGVAIGYNDLLANTPSPAHPEEYRAYSEMYIYLYGTSGYENTNIIPYSSLLQPLDICLNKVNDYAALNASDYATTTRVKDTCNVSGKPNTTVVAPLQNKYTRLPYTEEFLNSSLESTCTQDGQTQCRNQNYLYQKQSSWSLNGNSWCNWTVRNINIGGSVFSNNANNSMGIRPVVNLKSSVFISVGTGTQTDPYVLVG